MAALFRKEAWIFELGRLLAETVKPSNQMPLWIRLTIIIGLLTILGWVLVRFFRITSSLFRHCRRLYRLAYRFRPRTKPKGDLFSVGILLVAGILPVGLQLLIWGRVVGDDKTQEAELVVTAAFVVVVGGWFASLLLGLSYRFLHSYVRYSWPRIFPIGVVFTRPHLIRWLLAGGILFGLSQGIFAGNAWMLIEQYAHYFKYSYFIGDPTWKLPFLHISPLNNAPTHSGINATRTMSFMIVEDSQPLSPSWFRKTATESMALQNEKMEASGWGYRRFVDEAEVLKSGEAPLVRITDVDLPKLFESWNTFASVTFSKGPEGTQDIVIKENAGAWTAEFSLSDKEKVWMKGKRFWSTYTYPYKDEEIIYFRCIDAERGLEIRSYLKMPGPPAEPPSLSIPSLAILCALSCLLLTGPFFLLGRKKV